MIPDYIAIYKYYTNCKTTMVLTETLAEHLLQYYFKSLLEVWDFFAFYWEYNQKTTRRFFVHGIRCVF